MELAPLTMLFLDSLRVSGYLRLVIAISAEFLHLKGMQRSLTIASPISVALSKAILCALPKKIFLKKFPYPVQDLWHSEKRYHSSFALQTMKLSYVTILGGILKGKKIPFMTSSFLRPTCHRLRAMIMNVTMHRYAPILWEKPFTITGLRVADLYAGTGAFGLEALSRGASYITLVEANLSLCKQLHHTVSSLRVAEETHVVNASLPHGISFSPWRHDIVFLDPPYGSFPLGPTFQTLVEYQWLNIPALVMVEHPKTEKLEQVEGFHLQETRIQGIKAVSFFLYQGAPLPRKYP